MGTSKPLGLMLIEAGKIGAEELQRALDFQQRYGGRLGAVLTRLGVCSEDVILPVLAEQLGVPLLLTDALPDRDAVQAALSRLNLPPQWFEKWEALPWLDEAGVLWLASRKPLHSAFSELLRERGAESFTWALVLSETLDGALALLHPPVEAGGELEAEHLRELAEEAPIISLVNNILTQAVELGASDIHLEPEQAALRVRFRVDGVLIDRLRAPRSRLDAVVSRVKLMANLDIAERRLPQDGRLSIRSAGQSLDVRVSTLPGPLGESVVMRLLPKDQAHIDLAHLGLSADIHAAFRQVTEQPHGMVLVTGPTGSGKSTTLYALLDEMNNGQRKLITVEDPVEYQLDGVFQVQVQSDIGYDFSRALRAILRQDPDVLMIGEMRDLETARIGVQAALTGHAVLSTLHTNDAIGAFGRMLDMGVEPFLFASAVRGVLAQRLVRRVCVHCAEPLAVPEGMSAIYASLRERFPHLLPDGPGFRRARGCEHCLGTGYRGRVGIYEWVSVTERMSHLLAEQASTEQILAQLGEGFRSLQEDGLCLAWRGETTLEEVFRVTGELAADGLGAVV
ncbi:MAG: ATPase, T2SS/T4P/T4SS family [Gammaproteobacteria bacterium]|nr:ATPase, T2SS/T4P/T4SS family [Gammaproteobacteria bacterium]